MKATRVLALAGLLAIVTAIPVWAQSSPFAGTWVGKEDLQGYGRLELRLSENGAATMIDARDTVPGKWRRFGGSVVLDFFSGNVRYTGRLNGMRLSGNATSKNGKRWNWTVTLQGLVYRQRTGQMYLNGKLIGTGYSGKGVGRNNPQKQGVRNVGPIPRGKYAVGRPRRSARTGPHVMDLSPQGHNALGRTAFQIHGDNSQGDASEGCIVLPRSVRNRISSSGVSTLRVIE